MARIDVNEASTVCAARRLASAAAPDQGETVIVDPASGRYYGLDGTAVRVWALIQTPRRVSAVVDTLFEEYEATRAVLFQDVIALLRELCEAGLVEVVPEG